MLGDRIRHDLLDGRLESALPATATGFIRKRLTTAYQEDLLSFDELRQRLPALRQREGANRAELQSITDQIATRAAYLRLAQTLTAFLDRLRESADTLNVAERQRIVRLVVKEVLVVDDTIVIRHSIPVPGGAPDGAERTPPNAGGQRITPAASAQAATAGARLQPATPATLRLARAKVTFCVRGVTTPPCGVPFVR